MARKSKNLSLLVWLMFFELTSITFSNFNLYKPVAYVDQAENNIILVKGNGELRGK